MVVDQGRPHCPNGHLLGWIGARTSCEGAGCIYNIREVERGAVKVPDKQRGRGW